MVSVDAIRFILYICFSMFISLNTIPLNALPVNVLFLILFIYQYIYPGWAGYKNCILPQRPAENNVQEKSKYIQ